MIINIKSLEEFHSQKRDEYGNWEPSLIQGHNLTEYDYPYRNKENSTFRLPKGFWKNGCDFAVALTHDVDIINLPSVMEDWRRRRSSILLRPPVGLLKRSIRWLFQDQKYSNFIKPWCDLEKLEGGHSTFYFFVSNISDRSKYDAFYQNTDKTYFGEAECRLTDIMKHLRSDGFEIGLHGSFHSCVSEKELKLQKKQLEKDIDCPVYSIRQHYLRYDITKTPSCHQRAGFSNDTSLGFNNMLGFRHGAAYPYYLQSQAEHPYSVLQIPLIIQDGPLFNENSTEEALNLCKKLIDHVINVRGGVSILWHPDALRFPERVDVYTKLLRYIRQKNGWMTTSTNLAEYWKNQAFVQSKKC